MNIVISKDHAIINDERTPIAGCLEVACLKTCLRRDPKIAVKVGRQGCLNSKQKVYYIPILPGDN